MTRERKRPSRNLALQKIINEDRKAIEEVTHRKESSLEENLLNKYKKLGIFSLSDASEKSNLEALKFFLINIEDIEDCAPLEEWFKALYEAVKNRDSEIIAYLLDSDKEGNYLYYKRLNYSHSDFSNLYYGSLYLDECYPCELHLASKMGDIDTVKMLVEYNKVCEVEYNRQNTSWRNFTYSHIKEEEYINLKDREGNTALFYAVQNNHEDVVKYLAKKGSRLDIPIPENKLRDNEQENYTPEYHIDSKYDNSIYDSEYYNEGLDLDQQSQEFWEDIL